MSDQEAGLKKLRDKFADHQISKLPKPYKKDSPKGDCKECGGYHGLPAMHLDYVGHAALTDRLLDCDLNWNWEPLSTDEKGLPMFDSDGGLWIKLTVCGQTRLGYGNAEKSTFKEIGSRQKEVIGDALRNAAMRFGAALDLWHKGDLHPEEEKEDAQGPKTTGAMGSSGDGKKSDVPARPPAQKPSPKVAPPRAAPDASVGGPSDHKPDPAGETKFTVGIHSNKTFREVLDLEEKNGSKWSRDRYNDLKKGNTLPPDYVKFLSYAESKGVPFEV